MTTVDRLPFQPPSSARGSHAGDGKDAAPLATCPDEVLSAFLRARRRLFGIAYRMLGSAAEAEDIVQDVWVRWQTTDRSLVRNPRAFLVAATTRLAINVFHSARARRETCAGSWLPELVDTTTDPGLRAEQGEALNFAVLLLLEKLLPTERAAYVLREAFNYPYREIAGILRVEEANARQLVTRAREHVSGERRAPVRPAEQRRLLNVFVAAARTGDLARLESLLRRDGRVHRSRRAAVRAVHSAHGVVTTDLAIRSMARAGANSCIRFGGTARPGAALAHSRSLAGSTLVAHTEGLHYETRHHRRHWAHRVKARQTAARTRS